MVFKAIHVDGGNFICEFGLEGFVEEHLFIYNYFHVCFLIKASFFFLLDTRLLL